MANHASHAALPYPIKGARFTLLLPYLDADGDPTAPTTPDTEISKDNAAAADCAEEASATSGMDGMALLTLSGAETNCSAVALNAKVASGPKATLATLFPRVLAVVGSGTLSAGSAGGGTLGTLLAYDVTGCFLKTTGGTGGGGTGGANNQARKIITYNVGTGAFTVAPDWETTPDNTTTYEVLLPEGVTLGMLKALNPATAGRTLVVDAAGLADANMVKAGPTGSGTAQTARDLGGQLDAAVSTRSSHSAADVWAVATRVLTAGTNIALAKGVGVTGFNDLDAAGVRAAVGLASANLDTQLAALAGYIDAEVATILSVVNAIKAVTDLLPNGGALSSLATASALSAAQTDLTTLLARLSAARAGYLDNLSAGAVALASVCTEARLAELAAGNIPADVDTVLSRLSAARAGYLDNLSAGATALEATLTAMKGGGWSTETLVALGARLPAALTAGGNIKADALGINGSTAAAARLALSAAQIIPGTVDSTGQAPTATVFDADDITEATADHYIGRVVLWTTGVLTGQATTVTDYALVSGRGRFTVDAMTEAPGNDDTFILI